MVPACSFALSLPSSRARSAFLLHRLNRLAPIPAVSLLQARCAFTDQLLRLLSLSPLPSGSFCSLGIKAFNRRCSRPVRLLNSPDLCSLPANLSIASMALGSSFAVRYVSRDSLQVLYAVFFARDHTRPTRRDRSPIRSPIILIPLTG